jgi:hypothetical protein
MDGREPAHLNSSCNIGLSVKFERDLPEPEESAIVDPVADAKRAKLTHLPSSSGRQPYPLRLDGCWPL